MQSSSFFSEFSNSIYLFLFCKKEKIQSPGEHQEHQGEVLQGRSKSKIMFYYLIWKFRFLGSGFHKPTYLEM